MNKSASVTNAKSKTRMTEETPRQILFALCWRGGEGALDKIKVLYNTKQVRIDEVDENNVTALRFAAQYNHPEIVSYLLSLNSSTKIKAKDGIDPLLSAVEKRHVNIIKILLESGASPNNALSRDGVWCLKQARDNYHDEMVELLLKYGARDPKKFSEKCAIM